MKWKIGLSEAVVLVATHGLVRNGLRQVLGVTQAKPGYILAALSVLLSRIGIADEVNAWAWHFFKQEGPSVGWLTCAFA